MLFTPVLIVPVFNNPHRLEDPSVVAPILSLARANGITASEVWEVDAALSAGHGRHVAAITAIRLGGDGNPNTPADPNWTPLIPTQPHPEYVAAHPSLNGASAALLQHYFGDDDQNQSFTLTYPVAPSTAFGALPPGSAGSRSLTNIAQAEDEANAARLYGGLHYTSSIRASDAEGRAIADFVLRNVATQVDDEGEDFNAAGHNHGDGDCHGDGESATE